MRFGPKKKLTPEQIQELRERRANGALIKTLMQDYGISKVSVYRYLGATADSRVASCPPICDQACPMSAAQESTTQLEQS